MANTEATEKLEKAADKKGLDIFEFAQYLLRRIRIVLLAAAIGLILSGTYSYILANPIYEATAQIYVVNSRDSAINLSDLQIGSYLTSDYQWIFKTWEVNQQVINNLQLPYTVKEMRDMLTVTNPSNTRILMITFASESAKEAADVANEYASVASQYISDYMLTDRPSVISIALEPLQPVRPQKLLIMAVSVVIAGFIAVWCLFIAFICDDKIKTAADIKKHMGATPLAVIPITTITKPGREKER